VWSVFEHGGRDRLAIASGIALKNSMQRGESVVLAFTTPTEITRASDSVQLAQHHSLPIIYIDKIAANVRKPRPTSHELPAIPVDDADAVAIYRVAYEAIDKARRGAGPTLIQCVEHRGLTRNGRLKDQRADPVIYMERYLRKRNLWSDDLRV